MHWLLIRGFNETKTWSLKSIWTTRKCAQLGKTEKHLCLASVKAWHGDYTILQQQIGNVINCVKIYA